MDPHPDYADVSLPRDVNLDGVRLTPLSPGFVDEDFEAVMASAPVLGEVFGTWPEGLTREDNLIDLAWHEREFTKRRSFSWILRDESAAYIGCFYLYPDLGRRGHTTATLWLCDMPQRGPRAQAIQSALAAWLSDLLPQDIKITWVTSPAL